MGDDITIGVTEIVNNIEVAAQPNDQIVDISVIDNTDEVTLNITPTVIEINVNKGSSFAKWGTILGTLSDQKDLQDALDLKADLVDGKVPSSQLPSYVDDVIEVANYAALPVTGESGKIYVTIDNNKIYRWTGSTYVEITDNTAVWGAITGTLSSQTDLVNALNLRVPYTGATGDVNLGTYDIKAQKYWMLDEVNSNYGSMHFTDGNYHIEDASGHKLFVIEDGFIQLHKTDTIQSNLYTSGLTAIRDHYLPDASGTLALTSQLHNAVTIGTANGLSLSTQVLSLGLASGSANGALSSTDWTTFNAKQTALNGTGFVKISGTTISYDNSTYALDSAVVKLSGSQTISGVKTFSNMPILSAASGVNGQIVYADASNQLKTITNFKYNDATGVLTTQLGDLGSNAYTSTAYTPTARTLTINGTTFDLSANRSWTISAGISGSGTTGKIPLYTGSTALGDSSFTEFSTYVNLTKPLTIAYSTATSGQGLNLSLNNAGSTGTTLYLYNAGTGNLAQFQKSDNTTAFLINASGNVGIGTTSPSVKLHVVSAVGGAGNTLPTNATAIFDQTGNNLISISGGSANEAGIFMPRGTSAYYSGVFRSDTNLLFRNNDSEFMRITSGGNVGIGTTSPNSKIQVVGVSGNPTLTAGTAAIATFTPNAVGTELVMGGSASSPFTFWMQNRHTGINDLAYPIALNPLGGNVGIGTTSPSYKLDVAGTGGFVTSVSIDSSGTPFLYFRSTRASGVSGHIKDDGNMVFQKTESGGGFRFLNSSSTVLMAIDSGGNVDIDTLGTGLVYSNSGTLTSTNPSDSRLKDNIVSLNYGLNEILQLRPVTYNWKDDTINQGKQFGFIAQEVQEVMPELVKEFETEDGERLGLDKEGIYAALVNAIKEQNEVLEQLKAEIEILKTK